MTTQDPNHERNDEGFGLIEIVVSMLLLAALALALLPMLIQGLKQAAENATIATATQLVNRELDAVRGQTTCAGLVSGTTTTTDSRGVPLSLTKTAAACPTAFPGTVKYTITMVRTDTNKTIVTAATLVLVTGS